MNVIIEYICIAIPSTALEKSTPVRAFMDDLYLSSTTIEGAQILLDRASAALAWAKMTAKPSKSKCIVIVNGKVNHENILKISHSDNEVFIPSILDNPVKFLGRLIDHSLSDKNQTEVFSSAVSKGLSLIDRSFHRGVHKVWILQHFLVPRLRWPLLIYEIPISRIIRIEQKISCFIRKWLKLHNSTTNICLYSSVSPCPLPIKSLTSIMKSAKVSGQLLLRDSADPVVSSANIDVTSGKWSALNNVTEAENNLHLKEILGYHQSNRAGFGSFSIPEIPPKRSHEYRKLISSLVNELDEEKFNAKAVQLSVQGQWTKWCNFVRMDLSWKSMLAMPQPLLSFVLRATYDTLPSPSNLHRWHISSEASCILCYKQICTTAHVLGACKVALRQNRYTFRHDSVLLEIFNVLKSFLNSYQVFQRIKPSVSFVKAGASFKRPQKRLTKVC